MTAKKRLTKREKRSVEINELARILVGDVHPNLLVYAQDVVLQADRQFEIAKSAMVHDDIDRATDDERPQFIAAFLLFAADRSRTIVDAKLERETARITNEVERDREQRELRERWLKTGSLTAAA